MADPMVGGAGVGGSGGVTIRLEPPLEFILRQTGLFKRALQTYAGLFQAFGPVMSAYENEWWATQGHGAWPALAPSTQEEKARKGFSPWPLVRTEELMHSLTDPGRALRIHGDSAEWATDVPYSGFHQEGTEHMPMRQVIPDPFPVEWRRELERVTVAWIDGIAALTWGRI